MDNMEIIITFIWGISGWILYIKTHKTLDKKIKYYTSKRWLVVMTATRTNNRNEIEIFNFKGVFWANTKEDAINLLYEGNKAEFIKWQNLGEYFTHEITTI